MCPYLSLTYLHRHSSQGRVYVLQTVNRSLPGLLQNVINAVPFVKELVSGTAKNAGIVDQIWNA